ncbi:MAG: hypothetical protein OHK0023_23270 [Anaerolineae bacterium]
MPTKGVRTDFTEFDERVGQAWTMHFRKQDAAAIDKFEALVAEWDNHIDANYGLALCYRTSGKVDKARAAFEKTRTLVDAELAKNYGGETSRYQMLLRMIEQNLAMLG